MKGDQRNEETNIHWKRADRGAQDPVRRKRRREAGSVKPYLVQSFINDYGETASVRVVAPKSDAERVVEVSETEITLSPEANAVYVCGEVSALTLSDLPSSGSFVVVFTSGAEPTVLTVPQTLFMPEDFLVDADTRYEINVRDGYALAAGWPAAQEAEQ